MRVYGWMGVDHVGYICTITTWGRTDTVAVSREWGVHNSVGSQLPRALVVAVVVDVVRGVVVGRRLYFGCRCCASFCWFGGFTGGSQRGVLSGGTSVFVAFGGSHL